MYDGAGKCNWATNTNNKGNSPYTLVVENDGNLILREKNNNQLW
jgi:hypothetical protein